MGKNVVNCSRCGNTFNLTIKQMLDGVSCPHCNKKFMLNKKSLRRLKFLRYIFVFGICVAGMFAAQYLMGNNLAVSILFITAMFALMYLLARYADRLCGRILFHTFGVEYTDYVEEEKKRKK